MAYHLARRQIFAPGIFWDPREPLPPELVAHRAESEPVTPLPVGEEPSRKRPRHLLGSSDDPNSIRKKHARPIQSPGPDRTISFMPWQSPPQSLLPPLPTLTVRESDRNVLPPNSISLAGFVLQDTVTVTLTQIFYNDSPAQITKASYTFPLPTGCTITDFACRMGKDRILRGNVKPRAEAQQIFQNHIQRHGTGAALLEEHTPEIFTATLGNVPGNTRVTVTLTYITVLKHHVSNYQGVTTLTIPTCIASSQIAEDLHMVIEVVEADTVESIKCETHPITLTRNLGGRNATDFTDLAGSGNDDKVRTATVELKTTFLARDFVLDIATKPKTDRMPGAAQAWLEEHPTIKNQQAIMLTIPPALLTQEQNPSKQSEIIFLADRSGSMDDKMASVKSAMQFFLKGIPEGRYFNIWSFGSWFTSWHPRSVAYTEETLQSALSHVEQEFHSNLGGTELLSALRATVDCRNNSMRTDIIVLTDGQVWYLDQTLQYIHDTRKTTNGQVRFFSFGIGNAVSHALVEGIAKVGGGYCEVIPAAIQDGWEDRLVSMAKAALTSDPTGPLRVRVNCYDKQGSHIDTPEELNPANTQISPSDLSSPNPFVQSRIFILFDNMQSSMAVESVAITVTSGASEKTTIVPVKTLEKGEMVHKFGARSLLEDIEHHQRHISIHTSQTTNGVYDHRNNELKAAESIACKWSLVSKWTSFVLVEDGKEKGHGAVMARDSGVDYLLRPRVRHKTSSHYPSMIVSSCLEQEPCQVGHGGRDREINPRQAGGRTDGVQTYGIGSYSSNGLTISMMGPSTRSYSELNKNAALITGRVSRDKSGLTPQFNSTAGDIREILRQQKFDGSFDMGTSGDPINRYRDLCYYLIYISKELPDIAWPALITVAFLVLLWRDYLADRALWELMDIKARQYLQDKHGIVGGSEVFNLVRERLEYFGFSF